MSQSLKEYYNSEINYGVNNSRRRKINELVAPEVKQGNKRILDIGCSRGYLLSPLKINNNYTVGIDMSEKAIAEAVKVVDEAHIVDIESYPWPAVLVDQRFDIILCTEVIEHVFNQQALLDQIKSLLRPSGYAVITTPNFLVWSDRIKMLLGYYRVTDYGHIKMLSYKQFKELLKGSGLKIAEENHLWKPNWLEKVKRFISPNLFSYQMIVKIIPE